MEKLSMINLILVFGIPASGKSYQSAIIKSTQNLNKDYLAIHLDYDLLENYSYELILTYNGQELLNILNKDTSPAKILPQKKFDPEIWKLTRRHILDNIKSFVIKTASEDCFVGKKKTKLYFIIDDTMLHRSQRRK